MNPDNTIYDSDGQLQLVAEVRGQYEASHEWVADLHYTLISNKLVPNAPYFLLVLPDFLYLWRKHRLNGSPVDPDFIASTAKLFTPAFKKADSYLNNDVGKNNLNILLTTWLAFVLYADLTSFRDDADWLWLFESGLYSAIKGGKMGFEVETDASLS